jgi:D-serine deaminase-like pyridoxal phosphate-dependent protein
VSSQVEFPVPRLPEGLDTPAVVVDLDVVEGNIARLATEMRERGVSLRPHAKTHKSIEIGKMQLAAGAGGLTVGTLGEAEVMADAGIRDLFIAYPLWASDAKAPRLRALHDKVDLIVGVDSEAGAQALAKAVDGSGRRLRVAVEVDSGGHRTGVGDPRDAARVASAALAAGLEVVGVFTHGGHGYVPGDREKAAGEEVASLGAAQQALREAGIDAAMVSAGSTPTAAFSARGAVTEERPGTYVYGDRMQVLLGTCTGAEVALFVAATVVSNAVPGRIVIDSGAKALTKDRADWLEGHGAIPALPGAVIRSLYDYHAVVEVPDGMARPSVGEVLAVVPNHVCPVVDLVDSFVVSRGGRLVGHWPVDARGRSG